MLKNTLAALAFWSATAIASAAGGDTPAAPSTVRFAIVKTASLQTHEWLLFAGGRFEPAETAFSAFLVRHGDDLFLLDSGLGSQVDSQYRADMPGWNRPFFRYDQPVRPAKDQLAEAGLGPIRRIVVSHSHWDHLSGLGDFPQAEVWLAPAEHELVKKPSQAVGGVWPSQVAGITAWKDIEFDGPAFEGFAASQDMYGDGRAVLVPMPGHTPGSIGLFLTVDSGQRYFFVGDVVWNAGALKEGAPKNWAARWLVDHDVEQTQAAIGLIRAAMARDPKLIVIPAHDAKVQASLGHFPTWVQ
ncbi:MAG TPA: MBL fold metallo-hydrolase [Ideonella sp.]|uniref:MBL fold metallo-hydrolase n=1 Tax=Ideonella sp. TaxID=1929293 RepID=UPI002E379DB4|nr:MBL fold metallo-hydrolase [Ideonella sp.]HEX5686186.1 MBL fold metallo-hydrolase [Ideonella sp.]